MSTAAQSMVSPAPLKRRSWIARHKILTLLGILLVAAIVAGYIFAWPFLKWRFHALLAMSLAEIQHSPAAVEKLGEPISIPLQPWPSGRVDSNGHRREAQFYFTVAGPKSKANAVAILRMIDEKWGFTQLKLTCDDKTSIDLLSAIQGGSDVPKFDANAKQPDAKMPDMPVDINISLSDLPSEPRK